MFTYWVVPEKIHHAPKENIYTVWKWRGEKFVSDNSKCIRASEEAVNLSSVAIRGVNFQCLLWQRYGCFLE
jgi:hypothetical protein